MTQTRDIDSIRAEIDSIDVAVHDSLMRRVELAVLMADAKDRETPGRGRMRPGREAAILRTLFARHRDPLEFGVVARIWRELINANLRVEGEFTVAVYDGDDQEIGPVARAHYGDLTPFQQCQTAQAALEQAAENRNTVAVLPNPCTDNWWSLLGTEEFAQLNIVACLPFVLDGSGKVIALAVGAIDPEDTGDDLSFAIVQGEEGVLPSECAPCARTGAEILISTSGYKGADNPLWQDLRDLEGIDAVMPTGGYANPIILNGGG